MYAGSEGYIWRTSGDGAVRDTHKKENGQVHPLGQASQDGRGPGPLPRGMRPELPLLSRPRAPRLQHSGSSPITLTVPTNGLPANFYASIYQQGTGAISLATSGYTVSAGGPAGSSTNGAGSTLQLQRTGPGTLMVAASHVAGVDNNDPIWNVPAIAAVTAKGTLICTRPGTFAHAFGRLSAALTGATTIAVKKNGTLAATLTFASGAQSPTVVWASGSSFTVAAGDYLTYDVTAVGTGAADASFGFSI
jgi:hypothetical protein